VHPIESIQSEANMIELTRAHCCYTSVDAAEAAAPEDPASGSKISTIFAVVCVVDLPPVAGAPAALAALCIHD